MTRERLNEILNGITSIALAVTLGLLITGTLGTLNVPIDIRIGLWVLFVTASVCGALAIVLQALHIILAIMERRLRMAERTVTLQRSYGEIMVAEHAGDLGLSATLFDAWMIGPNTLLDCAPQEAVAEGRIDQVLNALEAFASGRSGPPAPPEPGPPEPPRPPRHRPVS